MHVRHDLLCHTTAPTYYRLVPSGPEQGKSVRDRGRMLGAKIAAAIAGLAITALLVYLTPNRADVAPAIASNATGPSIVILPFQDMTGDARWERLGNGLAVGLSGEFA